MHSIPLMFVTLLVALTLVGCGTSHEIKTVTGNQTGVQSKGQIITRCLDDASIEQCDKKYNP